LLFGGDYTKRKKAYAKRPTDRPDGSLILGSLDAVKSGVTEVRCVASSEDKSSLLYLNGVIANASTKT
jgi:hypothetical protein